MGAPTLTPEWIAALAVALPVIIGVLSKIIKLEGKTFDNAQSIKEIRTHIDNFDDKILDRLSAIEKSLARIQGAMSIKDEPS